MKYSGMKRIIILVIVLAMGIIVSGCSYQAEKYNEDGLSYLKNGDYASAIHSFDEAINENGRKAEYYVNKAYAQMSAEDYDSAADSLNTALAIDEDSRYVLRAQGILYFRTEKYDKAIESFEKCLSQTGSLVTELEYDVLMYKADAELSAGRAEDAAKTYSILIESKNDNNQFYYWRAKSYLAAGDEQGAANDLKAYIAGNKNYESYIQSYYELSNAGFEDSARGVLGDAMSLSEKTISDFKFRGVIYYILGEYNKAITEYQRIEDKDKNSEICIYEGMAFEAIGDIDNASKFYSTAVEKGGGDIELLYQVAVCNMNLGHYDDAIYYIDRGIEVGNDEFLEKLMYLEIICYERSQKYGFAAESVSKYIETFGSNEELEHELAFLKSRTEN